MVRTILLGLLLAGVIPTIVADATVIKDREDYKKFNLTSSVEKKQIYSQLRLQNIGRLLLSGSMLAECGKRSLVNPIEKSDLLPKQSTLSSKLITRFTELSCPLAWQSKTQPKLPIRAVKESIIPSIIASNTVTQFPKLSRSSLIVFPPPQRGHTQETKLANPAPATKRIASPFGWRQRPYSNQLQFHQGIDYGAPLGSSVVSAGNGIVTQVTSGCADFSNLFCGGQLGNWIEIDHGHGAIAVYGHLKHNSIAVKPGMKVSKNQQIAQVGSSGWSTGAHLDFRIKVNGEYVDPAKLTVAIESQLN